MEHLVWVLSMLSVPADSPESGLSPDKLGKVEPSAETAPPRRLPQLHGLYWLFALSLEPLEGSHTQRAPEDFIRWLKEGREEAEISCSWGCQEGAAPWGGYTPSPSSSHSCFLAAMVQPQARHPECQAQLLQPHQDPVRVLGSLGTDLLSRSGSA